MENILMENILMENILMDSSSNCDWVCSLELLPWQPPFSTSSLTGSLEDQQLIN